MFRWLHVVSVARCWVQPQTEWITGSLTNKGGQYVSKGLVTHLCAHETPGMLDQEMLLNGKVDHALQFGSPERPAQMWTNHLLQSSMKVWHHLGFCLTDTTDSALLLPPGWTSSAPKSALTHGGFGTSMVWPCALLVSVWKILLQLICSCWKPSQGNRCPYWWLLSASELQTSLWATGKQCIMSVHCCEV